MGDFYVLENCVSMGFYLVGIKENKFLTFWIFFPKVLAPLLDFKILYSLYHGSLTCQLCSHKDAWLFYWPAGQQLLILLFPPVEKKNFLSSHLFRRHSLKWTL